MPKVYYKANLYLGKLYYVYTTGGILGEIYTTG